MIYPIGEEKVEIERWARVNQSLALNNVCSHYLVSSIGRVFNDSTYNFLPQNINYDKDKYINIRLATIDGSFRQEMMQRIVLYVFNYIPGCENLDANHKDGIKYHNWIWNLEWTTHKENMVHAWENNLFKFGEQRNNTKISTQQADQICQLLEQGFQPKEIYNIFNGIINIKTIFNIRNGHCWSHISKNYNIDNSYKKSSTIIES